MRGPHSSGFFFEPYKVELGGPKPTRNSTRTPAHGLQHVRHVYLIALEHLQRLVGTSAKSDPQFKSSRGAHSSF